MGYADSLLATGERIVRRARQHWLVLLWNARIRDRRDPRSASCSCCPERRLERRRALRATSSAGVTLILFLGGLASWSAGATCATATRSTCSPTAGVMQVEGVVNKRATDSSLEKINDAVLTRVHLRADVRLRRPRRPDRGRERASSASGCCSDAIGLQEGDARREARARRSSCPARRCRPHAAPQEPAARPAAAAPLAAPAAIDDSDDGRRGRRRDSTRPRRPARPRRDHARGVRGQERELLGRL